MPVTTQPIMLVPRNNDAVASQWMPAPAVQPRLSPGLAYLTTVDHLFVKQVRTMKCNVHTNIVCAENRNVRSDDWLGNEKQVHDTE